MNTAAVHHRVVRRGLPPASRDFLQASIQIFTVKRIGNTQLSRLQLLFEPLIGGRGAQTRSRKA